MNQTRLPSTPSGHRTMAVMPFNRALIRYASRPFTIHAVLQIFFLGSRVLPGLVEKGVFDTITGQAQLSVSLWALIAAYIGIGLARVISSYWETFAGWTFRYTAAALVRRNLFAALLRRPGALPHPVAPGEAVYRYRNDVGEVCDFPTWLPDVAGNLVSFVAAIAIMATINWQITLVAFMPIVVAYVVGRAAWSRMLLYHKLEGEAGDRVTGFLAEMFGAVQALKVAGTRAEGNAVRHFERLNDERQRTAVQAKMLGVFAFSIHSFAVVVSTGVMLLMASRGMIAGGFTIGDFALFTYFLWFTSELPSYLGTFVGDYKQQEVAIARLTELVPEESTAAIVEHRPAFPHQEHVDWLLARAHSSPAVDSVAAAEGETSLPRAGGARPNLSARSIGSWRTRGKLRRTGRQLHGDYRASRIGKEHAAARRAWTPARAIRRSVLERRAGGRPCCLLPPAPQRLHSADAAPLQRHSRREYHTGSTGRGGRDGGSDPPGRDGAGCGATGEGTRHAGGAARRAPIGRAGAAVRGGAHVRTAAGAPGVR